MSTSLGVGGNSAAQAQVMTRMLTRARSRSNVLGDADGTPVVRTVRLHQPVRPPRPDVFGVRGGRDGASLWRAAHGKACGAVDCARLALIGIVWSKLRHDVIDSLDALRDAIVMSSCWPLGNVRFAQHVAPRNLIERTPAHDAVDDVLVRAPACEAPKSTAVVRGDDVSVRISIDRRVRSANARHLHSSRWRSLRGWHPE